MSQSWQGYAHLAETLEELHQASERMDAEAVKQHGRAYLDVAREIVKQGRLRVSEPGG